MTQRPGATEHHRHRPTYSIVHRVLKGVIHREEQARSIDTICLGGSTDGAIGNLKLAI